MRIEEEPASPTARLMQAKEFNLCIIALLGYNSTIDPNLYKKSIEQKLSKHPRFSSILELAEMMEKEELRGMWGNKIGIVLLPFTIALQDDPLTHIRRAKSNMDRKKLSLGHKSAFLVVKLIMFLFGAKIAACVTRAVFRNTTIMFSNVMGPQDEINLFGHPLSYIAPSIYGFPQSLIVHYQSYAGKLIISIGADEKLIPNPHQLCDDLVKSLGDIKEAVIKRGLLNASYFC